MDITVNELNEKLAASGYCSNDKINYAVWVSLLTDRPLLIEGAPGIGKSSLAKAIASALGFKFLELHCYDGLTSDQTMYSYNYSLQLLTLEAIKDKFSKETEGLSAKESIRQIASEMDFYGPEFLLKRPLLESITSEERCVLLIDELDKQNDEVLEHQLLEILDTYSMSIPEYKTVHCDPDKHPVVIITSNGYKELSGALRRRCNYLYIPQKSHAEVVEILKARANVNENLCVGIARCYIGLQGVVLKHTPSIAELIEYTKILGTQPELTKEFVTNTLSVLVKDKRDQSTIQNAFSKLLKEVF